MEHGPAIMRHQNSVVPCRAVKQLRIADSLKPRLTSRGEIDGRLAPPDRLDNRELEIVVCLETETQGPGSPILALARCIFSHSTGLACAMGTPPASNSRSVSARDLSISDSWSR